MFQNDRAHDPEEVTTLRTLLSALALTSLSVLGFFVVEIWLADPWQSVLTAILSVSLSIGLIGLIWELTIRKSVSRELLRLVGIQRSVSKHHLRRLGDASRIDWPSVLEPASRIRVLMGNPRDWVQAHWGSILKGGRDHPLNIELVFPDPEGDCIEQVADFCDLEVHQLRESIDRVKRIVEDEWKQAVEAGRVIMGSHIAVRFGNIFPTYSIVRADASMIVTIFPSTVHPPADNGFYFQFFGQTSDYPINWFDKELRKLAEHIPAYENDVEEDER